MGNSSAASSSRFLPGPNDFKKAFFVREYSSSTSNTQTEVKVCPLVLVRDEGCQTVESSYLSKSVLQKIRSYNYSRLIVYCGTAYLIMCLLVTLSPAVQSFLMFLHFARWPSGDLTNLPRFGLQPATVRNIAFNTSDNLVLRGYHLVPPHSLWREDVSVPLQEADFDRLLRGADRVVVYFHGTAGTRATPFRLAIVRQLATHLNAHVVAFDYRGFGDSAGSPSEEGTYLDGLAAVAWLHDRWGSLSAEHFPMQYAPVQQRPQRRRAEQAQTPTLYLYGQSLGSGVATEVARRLNVFRPQSVQGLVLDAAFSSARSGASTHPVASFLRVFPWLTSLMMSRLHIKYENELKIAQVQAPMLLLHGLRDHKVPPRNSAALQAALLRSDKYEQADAQQQRCAAAEEEARWPVQLRTFAEADHNTVHAAADYVDTLLRFFRRVETPAPSCS